LVDRGRLQMKWLFNRYSVVLIVIAIVILQSVNVNTGSMAYYLQFSKAFDGERAQEIVDALSDPAFEGRALGTAGMESAAGFIAAQFKSLGLQAAGNDYTYFDTRLRFHTILDDVPQLSIDDTGIDLMYRQDFVEYAGTKRNTGEIQGDVTFVIAGELTPNIYGEVTSLSDIEVSDQVLVFLTESDAAAFDSSSIPIGGMLVIADKAADLGRRSTLPTGGPTVDLFSGRPLEHQDYPKLWIGRDVAQRLLAGRGASLLISIARRNPLARVTLWNFIRTSRPPSMCRIRSIQRRQLNM
jgi:hypothetical protein